MKIKKPLDEEWTDVGPLTRIVSFPSQNGGGAILTPSGWPKGAGVFLSEDDIRAWEQRLPKDQR